MCVDSGKNACVWSFVAECAVEWKWKTNNPLGLFTGNCAHWPDNYQKSPTPCWCRCWLAHPVIRASQPLAASRESRCSACAKNGPQTMPANCFVLHCSSSSSSQQQYPNQSSGMRISCGVWISYFASTACRFSAAVVLFWHCLPAHKIYTGRRWCAIAIASRLNTSASRLCFCCVIERRSRHREMHVFPIIFIRRRHRWNHACAPICSQWIGFP